MTSNIVRVFPRKTRYTPDDDYSFIGDPPMMRPQADEVHISCVFTWDKPRAEYLQAAWSQYYPVVKIGGPAYDDSGNGFIPGMYIKKGYSINSRGCNHNCPWCVVPLREGPLRLLPITEGNNEQSNNLLQCPATHVHAVFDMLSRQKKVVLAGGIDATLLNQEYADRIRSLNIDQVFLACDTDNAIKPLRKAVKLLQLPFDKVRCYVLLKYNPEETRLHALIRLLQVWEAGCKPFAQLYQPVDKWIDYPVEWRRFARTWQRPAASAAFIRDMVESNKSGSH